jgi:hypothetical protein
MAQIKRELIRLLPFAAKKLRDKLKKRPKMKMELKYE